MAAKATHKWAFRPGMRAGAYSWKSSAKAIERLKSASSEIRAVAKVDPVTAAEGVIALAQRIWPAFEHIDTSSGALGNAVGRTLEELLRVSTQEAQEITDAPHWIETAAERILDWSSSKAPSEKVASLRTQALLARFDLLVSRDRLQDARALLQERSPQDRLEVEWRRREADPNSPERFD